VRRHLNSIQDMCTGDEPDFTIEPVYGLRHWRLYYDVDDGGTRSRRLVGHNGMAWQIDGGEHVASCKRGSKRFQHDIELSNITSFSELLSALTRGIKDAVDASGLQPFETVYVAMMSFPQPRYQLKISDMWVRDDAPPSPAKLELDQSPALKLPAQVPNTDTAIININSRGWVEAEPDARTHSIISRMYTALRELDLYRPYLTVAGGGTDMQIDHPVAHPSCTCGFYAYTSPQALYANTPWSYSSAGEVYGLVRGYGHVTVGSLGFRAEKADIVALTWPGALKAPDAPGVHLVSDLDELVAWARQKQYLNR
jgi:hypothetical protein